MNPYPAEQAATFSVARSSSKHTAHLAMVPQDGAWYVLATDLAPSTAEQIARKIQGTRPGFEFGYRQLAVNGFFRSELAARSTNQGAP